MSKSRALKLIEIIGEEEVFINYKLHQDNEKIHYKSTNYKTRQPELSLSSLDIYISLYFTVIRNILLLCCAIIRCIKVVSIAST